MRVNLIFAVDSNWGIGYKNRLPWPKEAYKEDLAHFQAITQATTKVNYLICGYRTYLGLKKKKMGPKRRLVVINKKEQSQINFEEKTPIHLPTLQEALTCVKKASQLGYCDKVFVIGGKSSIEEMLKNNRKKIGKIYCTLIKKRFPSDVAIDPNLMTGFELDEVNVIRDMHFCSYILSKNSAPEEQYINLVQKILDVGKNCSDRTGVGTRSIFGHQMQFDMDRYYPLLTTKKVFFKGIVEELLWFLRGETNVQYLQKKSVHIWDDNTTRAALDKAGLTDLTEGDMGAGYGFQFRHFGATYKDCKTDYRGKGFDQVKNVLQMIRNNPSSRRIIISLWNPLALGRSALPPCHILYQFRVYGNKLSCSMYQRSGDVGLGVPFNIASSACMTYLFAFLTGLQPGKLIYTLGDAHIYLNHLKTLTAQIKRAPLPFPKLSIKDRGQKEVEDFERADFHLLGYLHQSKLKMDMAI